MNVRLYDPVIGRFLSPDPYVQAPDFSQNFNRYSYAYNNPFRYTDPNGEFLHILIGAALGGTVNLIYKAATRQINSWQDGFVAFGIGAIAGGVGAATGGAAFLAAGGGAAGVGGIIAGVSGGVFGYMGSAPIQNIGNHLYFGDPLMSTGEYAVGLAFSGLTGGITNGIAARLSGKNIWNGKSNIPEPSPTAIATTKPNPGKVEPEKITLQNVQKSSVDVNKVKMQQVRELGIEGEKAVGISGGKEQIESLTGTARYRIPDRLTWPKGDMPVGVLEEVKNVAYLRDTPQIRDFLRFSQEHNLKFIIYTRTNTVIAPPLRPLIENQTIIRIDIPK